MDIKLCPSDDYNDNSVSGYEQLKTYEYYIRELVRRDAGFINLSRRRCSIVREQDDYFKTKPRPEGLEMPDDFKAGKIDLAFFGRPFIDFPVRSCQ